MRHTKYLLYGEISLPDLTFEFCDEMTESFLDISFNYLVCRLDTKMQKTLLVHDSAKLAMIASPNTSTTTASTAVT